MTDKQIHTQRDRKTDRQNTYLLAVIGAQVPQPHCPVHRTGYEHILQKKNIFVIFLQIYCFRLKNGQNCGNLIFRF